MPKVYPKVRARTPHLPFEAPDPATLPGTYPVMALWHGNAFSSSFSNSVSPFLPEGQTNLAGTRHNVATYPYYMNYTDVLTTETTENRGKFGGYCNGRLVEGQYPRGTNDGWGVDAWRTWDQTRELIVAREAGFDVMQHEPASYVTSDADWKHFQYAFDATERVGGGIKTALQIDCPALRNSHSSTDAARMAASQPAAAAATVLPYLQRPSHWTVNGRIPVAAFDPEALDEVNVNWFTQFFAALPTNVQFMPCGNSNPLTNGRFERWKPLMERAGGTSWWARWDTPRRVPRITGGTQLDSATYFWTNGGHNNAWLMNPQFVTPRNGYFWETEGFRLMWEQFQFAFANRHIGDALYWSTWNDLSEGGETCPSEATQWGVIDFAAYLNYWWRTGTAPTIVRDCIYYMHRMHEWDKMPSAAQTYVGNYTLQPGNRFGCRDSSDVSGKNLVYLAVFLTAPADVQVITAEATTTHSAVPAGVTLVDAPLPSTAGGNVRIMATRDSAPIIDFTTPFPVLSSAQTPTWQDLLYRSGSSLRMKLGQTGYPPHVIEPVQLVRNYIRGKARNA